MAVDRIGKMMNPDELFQAAKVHLCLDFRFKIHPTVCKLLMNSQNELTSELSATSLVGCVI